MLVKRFELVGSLLHTCRPWSDVVNACNGMGMKFKCTIEGAFFFLLYNSLCNIHW